MDCVVPSRGIRAFGKAVQCLAKIGEDLHIEALTKGLSLRTVNSAHSAFGRFLFRRTFFSSYSDGHGRSGEGGKGEGSEEEEEEEEEDIIRCKITIKSVLSVFRALSSLEKTVDYFSLSINLKLSKLVFIFHCRHGIVKTHQLGFQECESLRAVFSTDLSPNHIKVQSRTLGEVVGNFPSFLEEVTMAADPESIRLKNYCGEDSVDLRCTMTEVRLMPAEFDEYQIGVDTAITFCLKELRAILLFTDALPHSVSVHFESPGGPVVFTIDESAEFRADFALATILHVVDPTTSASNGTSLTASTTTNAAAVRPKNSTYRQKDTRQNGRGKRRGTGNGQGLPRHNQRDGSVEDEWSHPFSRPSRVKGRQAGGEGSHRSSESSSPRQEPRQREPSGSDGGGSMIGHSSTDGGGATGACGDGEGDVMMVGEEEEEEGRDTDPLDALFGEENMMDVGEAGWEGGGGGDWGGGGFAAELCPTTTSHSEHQQPPLPGTASTPPSHSPRPHASHPLTPTSPPAGGDEGGWRWEGVETTQDSILEDSGFLPGTPPAKKFKATSSLLLGEGLLHSDLPTPRQPAILAPDSEGESD